MKAAKTCAGWAGLLTAFVAAGMLFAGRMGIEADEAIVGNGIYDRGAPWYSLKWRGFEVPVMLLSYLGALKTWFYNLLFQIVAPTAVSLRLPMLLIAASSIWVFFRLLDVAVGRRAAWMGALLLATDSSYLLMNAADYGPVTLQFFLKLTAMLLILKFHRAGSLWMLAGGFFLIGLALWDKAVFLWVLFGLGIATAAVFPREALRRLSLRTVAVAAAGLLAGALPLLIYNLARPLDTLRSNAKLSFSFFPVKADLLLQTMDGKILFGFMTAADPGPQPGQPAHWYQSLSLCVAGVLRHPHHNLTLLALLLTIAALPFLWNTPARAPILFGLIACAGTWLAMAVTADAGWAAQHTILLWPFHFLAIAAALAQLRGRLAAGLCALLVLSNAAVTNQYDADLIRNGPAIRWTDAIGPLNQSLAALKAPEIFCADWGFFETLNLLSEGRLPVSPVDAADSRMNALVANPEFVFVAHAAPFAYHPEVRDALDKVAGRAGISEEPLATISDRNGRPTFEIFRFRRSTAGFQRLR